MNWKKIDRRLLVLIIFAIHGGIFDGLFGIDAVRNQVYPVDYLSFWGAYLSVYFFIGIVVLFGIKDKFRLLQAVLLGFAIWGFARFIYLFDALRIGLINPSKLMMMRFEFTNILGTPINFNFYEIIMMNSFFLVGAIIVGFYKNRTLKKR